MKKCWKPKIENCKKCKSTICLERLKATKKPKWPTLFTYVPTVVCIIRTKSVLGSNLKLLKKLKENMGCHGKCYYCHPKCFVELKDVVDGVEHGQPCSTDNERIT